MTLNPFQHRYYPSVDTRSPSDLHTRTSVVGALGTLRRYDHRRRTQVHGEPRQTSTARTAAVECFAQVKWKKTSIPNPTMPQASARITWGRRIQDPQLRTISRTALPRKASPGTARCFLSAIRHQGTRGRHPCTMRGE